MHERKYKVHENAVVSDIQIIHHYNLFHVAIQYTTQSSGKKNQGPGIISNQSLISKNLLFD